MDLPDGVCRVWWASPAAAADHLVRLLDDAERDRHRRFLRPADRDLYLTAHALTRIVLGDHLGRAPAEVGLYAECARCGGPHGKPRLRDGDLEFSLSHSGDRVGVAVTRAIPVGLDVEQEVTGRDLDSLIAVVLSPGERAADAREFTTYWTRKEAVLKTTGDGLSVPMTSLTVSPPGEPADLLSWPGGPAVALHDLSPGAGHLGCVGSLAPVTVEERDGTPLLA